MYGLIYRIINKINGKLYVGQTISDKDIRWNQHIYASKNYDYPIYRAIKKYGIENFYIEQLDVANNEQELNDKEMYYILSLNTAVPQGYNVHLGGDSKVPNEDTKIKMSLAKKGKMPANLSMLHCQETYNKIGNAHRGKPKSAEHNRKNSEANKGKRLGFKMSEEAKNNISIAKKGKKNPNLGIGKRKPIVCLNNNKTYASIKEASIELNIDQSDLGKVCKGLKLHARGYKFRYLKDIQREQSLI